MNTRPPASACNCSMKPVFTISTSGTPTSSLPTGSTLSVTIGRAQSRHGAVALHPHAVGHPRSPGHSSFLSSAHCSLRPALSPHAPYAPHGEVWPLLALGADPAGRPRRPKERTARRGLALGGC